MSDDTAVTVMKPKAMMVGDAVYTAYGPGSLLFYRETDRMYVVQLEASGAKLYARRESILDEPPPPPESQCAAPEMNSKTMELNVAYEALESMRLMNLQIRCRDLGVHDFHISKESNRCTACLIEQAERQDQLHKKRLQQERENAASAAGNKKSSWLLSKINNGKAGILSSTSNTVSTTTSVKSARKGTPCLICGAPTCKHHSCNRFRRQGITLCNECKLLFNLDFVIDCLTCDKLQRAQKIDKMVDTYDRTLLLLRYSSQFIKDVAAALEASTARTNKVNVGSSSCGIVSGAVGIAAAVSIFTPVGPPLLIASLLFGASATAVQTSAEAINYYSEPNVLADRILALHGMLHSILRLAGTLRDAMLRDHIRTDQYLEKVPSLMATVELQQTHDVFSKHRAKLMAGMTLGRYASQLGVATAEAAAATTAVSVSAAAVTATKTAATTVSTATNAATAATTSAATAASMAVSTTTTGVGDAVLVTESGMLAGRNARFFTRAGANSMQAARFVQFAGGALSAATLLLEARCMHQTISAIKAGNPCLKADLLRTVQDELLAEGDDNAVIPPTELLDKECQRYLELVAKRERTMTEKEVVLILLEFSDEAKAALTEQEKADLFLEENSVVDGNGSQASKSTLNESFDEDDDFNDEDDEEKPKTRKQGLFGAFFRGAEAEVNNNNQHPNTSSNSTAPAVPANNKAAGLFSSVFGGGGNSTAATTTPTASEGGAGTASPATTKPGLFGAMFHKQSAAAAAAAPQPPPPPTIEPSAAAAVSSDAFPTLEETYSTFSGLEMESESNDLLTNSPQQQQEQPPSPRLPLTEEAIVAVNNHHQQTTTTQRASLLDSRAAPSVKTLPSKSSLLQRIAQQKSREQQQYQEETVPAADPLAAS